jgi:hypothetical protein
LQNKSRATLKKMYGKQYSRYVLGQGIKKALRNRATFSVALNLFCVAKIGQVFEICNRPEYVLQHKNPATRVAGLGAGIVK